VFVVVCVSSFLCLTSTITRFLPVP
jgi:hypothetical protein